MTSPRDRHGRRSRRRHGRTRTAAAALVAAAAFMAAAAPLSAQPPPPERAVPTADTPERCDPARVSVLLLFDTSSSLRRSDPHKQRLVGGTAAADDLARIAAEFPASSVEVAVAGFAADPDLGRWHRLGGGDSDGSVTVPAALTERLSAVAARDDGSATDYRAALSAAEAAFSELDAQRCKLLIWFTDGAHDTERGTGSRVTAAESAELDAMCAAGGVNERLNTVGAATTAVLLSGGGHGITEPLQRLFGESGTRGCLHPLVGEIAQEADVNALAGLLRSHVEDAAWKSIEQPAGTLPCAAETQTSECRFEFEIPASAASFDVHVSFKDVDRPGEVTVTAVPPSGAALPPFEFGAEQAMHASSGMLAWSPTARWRQLRGHVAAEAAPGRTGGWEWAGTWTLLFAGTGSDAVRVAPPRVAVRVAPEVTVEASESGDRMTGTVGLTDGASTSVMLRLGAGGAEIGNPAGYPADSGGRWEASGVRAAARETLIRSGQAAVLLPVSVSARLLIPWGGTELAWETEPRDGPSVVLLPLGDESEDAARLCQVIKGTSDLSCSWAFEISAGHEAFAVRLGDAQDPIGGGQVQTSLLSPDGSRFGADLRRSARGPIAVSAESDSAIRLHAHRAVIEQAGHDWAGPWLVTAEGSFEAVADLAAPALSVVQEPSVTARFDAAGGMLAGIVARPPGSPGSAPQGSVRVTVNEPGRSLHDATVGPEDGYPVVGGRWAADSILADLMAVPGARSMLRSTRGDVSVTATHLATAEWDPHPGDDRDDRPGSARLAWTGRSAPSVTLRVPASLGWDSEWVHPWVTGVVLADDPDSGGWVAEVAVRRGLEAGALRAVSASLRDASGVEHGWDTSGWGCAVPASGGDIAPDAACPPLMLAGVPDASDGIAAATLAFSSLLDDAEGLLGSAAERGLRAEAAHLYAPVLQPDLAVPVVVPGGGLGLVMAALLMGLLIAAAAGAFWFRRRRG